MDRTWASLVSLFLLVACAGAAQPAPPELPSDVPPTPAELPTDAPLPTIVQPGACEHLLWPVVDGALWEYQLSRQDGTTQNLTLTATVAGESADLLFDMGGGPQSNVFTCTPEGLYGALRGILGHPDLGPGLMLAEPDSPFLPSPDQLLPLGMQVSWNAQYRAGGMLTLASAQGPVEVSVTGGDVALVATANPLESITTLAGTFNALPVEQSMLFNLQVTTGQGGTGAVFGDAYSRHYWAEGVGLVRVAFEGGTLSSTLEGAPISLTPGVTIELVSYEIPGR